MEFVCEAIPDKEEGVASFFCKPIGDVKDTPDTPGCIPRSAIPQSAVTPTKSNLPDRCQCFQNQTFQVSGSGSTTLFFNGGQVTLTYTQGTIVSWNSTSPQVQSISVGNEKGSLYNIYTYAGTRSSDTGLVPPEDPANIGSVYVCFGTLKESDLTLVTRINKTSYKRTYDWTLACASDPVILSPGQVYDAPVSINGTAAYQDSEISVSAEVSVTNNGPASTIISVNGVSTSIPLATGATASVPFVTNLSSIAPGDVTVTIVARPDGTCGLQSTYTSSAGYTFGAPTTSVGNNITLSVGSATQTFPNAGANGSASLTGTVTVGSYNSCGDYVVPFTGSLTDESGVVVSTTCNIAINVACGDGCTLSQGYWKTHSRQGPAPYDSNWGLIGVNEEQTPFFISGQTYHQVLNTAPRGNLYYVLAVQYIAAELNKLKGTGFPAAVLAAYNAANGILQQYTPAQIGALSSQDPLRKQITNLATVLANYNSGLLGVPYCSQTQ